MPGIVPVLLGGLRLGFSVVLVPLLLMLLMTPSVPLLRPVLVCERLPVTLGLGIVEPGAAGLGMSAGLEPSARLPLACA